MGGCKSCAMVCIISSRKLFAITVIAPYNVLIKFKEIEKLFTKKKEIEKYIFKKEAYMFF